MAYTLTSLLHSDAVALFIQYRIVAHNRIWIMWQYSSSSGESQFCSNSTVPAGAYYHFRKHILHNESRKLLCSNVHKTQEKRSLLRPRCYEGSKEPAARYGYGYWLYYQNTFGNHYILLLQFVLFFFSFLSPFADSILIKIHTETKKKQKQRGGRKTRKVFSRLWLMSCYHEECDSAPMPHK